MPSVDEVASSAKANLRSSLMITHNLTLDSSSPSDFVIHRMNDALRAVIDNNFATPSMDAVGALYAAIGDAQPHMVSNAHELALVNLSRTFAVVLEEAIKMKGMPTGSAGNNNSSAPSGGEWSNVAQSSGIDKWQASSGAYAKPPTTTPTTVAAPQLKGFGPQLSKTTNASGVPAVNPAATPTAAPISAAEIARRKEKEAKKDYSPEAIEGRITVFKIPIAVTEPQLRGHFEKIGDVDDLSYPIEQGKHKGFALLKFKDNDTADEVCRRLHGTNLGGSPLVVERAKHWFRKDPAPAFGTGRANAVSVAGAGIDSRLASASSSLEGTTSTFSVTAPESHESSDEEVADNEEEDSSDEEVDSDEDGSDPGIC